VAAIIARARAAPPSLESIQDHCRSSIAGYKLPRRLFTVETIQRSPSGKPDYRWADGIVLGGDAAPDAG